MGVQVRSGAIPALQHAVREPMPTVEFVVEESPAEEFQSNSTIEIKVHEIQKNVMKSALEERLKFEAPSRQPILAFLVGTRESCCQGITLVGTTCW